MEERRHELHIRALHVGPVHENEFDFLPNDVSLALSPAPAEALRQLCCEPFHCVVVGCPIPDWSAELLLEHILRLAPSIPVVVCDPAATVQGAVRLIRQGAFDVVGPQQMRSALENAVLSAYKSQPPEGSLDGDTWRSFLIGRSPAIERIVEMIRLVASRKCTVLLTGETGTGKEMVARAIHAAGNRASAPLVSVNCSALPEALLEAELFGHVKGAFTGAITNRIGRFEQANKGTLFLDEIGDLPLALQAKLLRVLQEREVQKLGSSETIQLDLRVIAATNVNLADQIRRGKFREDLYYRLNVVPIGIPPLRERTGDIPLLAQHFVAKICAGEGIPAKQLSPEVIQRLSVYDWPGNVRQLENAIEMAVTLSGDRWLVNTGDLNLPLHTPEPPGCTGAPFVALPDHGLDFERTVGNIERHILEQALQKTRGNKKAAAEMLRLKRTTLSAKLKTLSLAAAAAV